VLWGKRFVTSLLPFVGNSKPRTTSLPLGSQLRFAQLVAPPAAAVMAAVTVLLTVVVAAVAAVVSVVV
jgi:hypothetical protein